MSVGYGEFEFGAFGLILRAVKICAGVGVGAVFGGDGHVGAVQLSGEHEIAVGAV